MNAKRVRQLISREFCNSVMSSSKRFFHRGEAAMRDAAKAAAAYTACHAEHMALRAGMRMRVPSADELAALNASQQAMTECFDAHIAADRKWAAFVRKMDAAAERIAQQLDEECNNGGGGSSSADGDSGGGGGGGGGGGSGGSGGGGGSGASGGSGGASGGNSGSGGCNGSCGNGSGSHSGGGGGSGSGIRSAGGMGNGDAGRDRSAE
ncbi:hypothetical protein JKP88DRAFT_324940 [Tribonema minus]|uniref:Uncharacterized protein n=1 Tax=Tribonema minus TaxID=303371 RepID=A0A835YS41_9STRA|nr:hypothetical protein JKP88DRAFT_324940 [Tribonema minus]